MQTIIQTPTNKLKNSIHFYKTLGFTHLEFSNKQYFLAGKIKLFVNEERTARAGIIRYASDWSKLVREMKTISYVHEKNGEYIIRDPNNCTIILSTQEKPEITEDTKASLLGNYMGLSLEASDMIKSIAFWNKMGFKIAMGKIETGWVAMFDDTGFGISLMQTGSCPHLFYNPSLTFFNGEKNLSIIQEIRSAGIPITEEITHFNKKGIVDNIIIRDPGGLGFFIFSD